MRTLTVCCVPGLALALAAAGGAVPLAEDVVFDNTSTNYVSTDVQGALEEVDAAVLGDVAHFRDVNFPEPVLNGDRYGLHWPVSDPSVTEFFLGVGATDEGGSLAQTNNVFCASYNFDECSDTRINGTEHAWKWMWQASVQDDPLADVFIQNDVVFTASDGTSWQPWSFHINADDRTASFRFDTSPTHRAFTIDDNGNVRVGPDTGSPPTHQLEVNGSFRVSDNLTVQGNLLVEGVIVHVTNTSPLLWGDANDANFDTGTEVCAAAGLVCSAVREPDGTAVADCDTPAPAGIFYTMCRQQ